MNCRHCNNPLEHIFLDLGFAPPSNAYLKKSDLCKPETYFPLKIYVCNNCWLVQTEDYADADKLFCPDYAYFSSTSQSWLDYAKQYSEMIVNKLSLDSGSMVIEIASNDGYLLKNFTAAGIPCLGIEPTAGTADVAEKLGVPVLREFFGNALGVQLAAEKKKADLIIGNNVFAHVPDINDFTAGLKSLLKQDGTITLEFPHLLQLIMNSQFDTVYHEHYSYLSLYTVNRIFARAGLKIWDVEELPTHGGSLRVYGCRADADRPVMLSVTELIQEEKKQGLQQLETYLLFQPRVDKIKNNLLAFLLEQKQQEKKVAAYGAAAKGNTLLNYAGVKGDFISFVCDAAPSKQGRFMPGSHLPILPPEALADVKPDYVIILPWNIKDEVMAQQECVRKWGGKFVIAVPELIIL